MGENQGIFGQSTPALAKILPEFLAYKSQRDLLRCGYYSPHAYDSYLALRNLLVAGFILATMCWAIAVADNPQLTILVFTIGGVVTLLAYSLPRIYLSWQGDRRAERILVGLPDGLEMIVMCMTGGHSLQQAIQRCASDLLVAHPDLAAELKIISQQTITGSLAYALGRFSARLEIDEVTNLTQVVNHAQQTGSPLSLVLRNSADELRRARMQRAEERGNKLALKMLFPTVLCLAPAAFIVIFAPPLLNLRNFRDQENQKGGILSQQNLKVPQRTSNQAKGRTSPNP